MMDVLVANRGEIAIRVIRAVRELGGRAVSVCPADDGQALHARRADAVRVLPGAGPAAYLDGQAIIAAAAAAGCQVIHPGYGFLSENAAFARDCARAGITFVGPDPGLLDLLADKTRARALAAERGIPVLPATAGPATLAQARAFAAEHGPVMLKAVAGGGGRGMRAVADPGELAGAFERCRSEALRAFGNPGLYAERLLARPRHVEIQIAGDGTSVQHAGDRDCSIQRRHQKLIEIAPSPSLSGGLRERITRAALRLAGSLGYRGLGTVEFLVDGEDFFFLEVNPRLQVEHTVTEEVAGIDLVTSQIRLAAGARLADVGLAAAPTVRGCAIQARVNLETLDLAGSPRPAAGTIEEFAPPSGPGVRVDTCGYPGLRVSPRYDSLIAKVIGRGGDFPAAAARTAAALAEFSIGGVPANLDLLHGVLTDPAFTAGQFDTSFLATALGRLSEHQRPAALAPASAQVPPPLGSATPGSATPGSVPRAVAHDAVPAAGRPAPPDGAASLTAPLAGVVLSVEADAGDLLPAGGTLLVIEAMKMEHVVRARAPVRLEAVLVTVGTVVEQGDLLGYGSPAEEDGTLAVAPAADEDWSGEVTEIERRRALAREMGGPAKVTRQRAAGKLTARERIDAIADPGSFAEIGALTGFARYDKQGHAAGILPANFVAGTARIGGRKVILGADDFTIRGGSGDAAIHAKQIFAEEYARQMRLPVVRLLDGASGGGSVQMTRDAGYTYVPVNPAWDAVVDNLSLVPVAAACLGPTVGLGAARLVMSHLAVMVAGIGQLFTAGPPVVRGATGEDLTKDELGGAAMHRGNGSVERIVADEPAAFAVIRDFLAYLPASVFEIPPVAVSGDPPDRREEGLLAAIPRNRRRPYPVEPILRAIFDTGSVFTYAEYGGGTVTALARLDGHPVGVIAADPFRGTTMSAEGAQAIWRLVDLCETFHLPIVSLTDQAGVTIGAAAERRASIRAGARAITAVYQARVPQAEVILRRVYGVGGAGIINRHRAGRSWAWPSGDWGSLPVQGGIEAAFRAQIEASADPGAEISAIAAELAALASPFRTAERFGVQDLIDPRDTRPLLCDWVRDAYRLLPGLAGRPAFGTRP